MGVTIGTQLGSLEILALLGRGGMGEVYRARDTKLKREVAIKVLPDEFSRDPDRVSRFQREAEVLASLNHPAIAAIYDLEEANGSRFLVLELVEGETLAERIKRGAVPIDEALNIAKTICEALEAAHEKGIIHRDLKPANVKITPDGKVKVLDFGLAKAMESGPTNPALSNSPTLSLAATNAGVILGTAAYMSPEQAKGMTVDRRTDIFAFGAVLYEMLTGQQTFQGDTVGDILAAVIRADPNWDRLPAETPSGIRRLLRRCLRKDRNHRLHTAADARIELEEAHEQDRSEQAVVAARGRSQTKLAWIVAGLSLVTTVALASIHFRESPPPDAPEMRVDILTPPTTDAVSMAISPDGRRLVFVAPQDGQMRLWVRPLDAVTAQPLAGTDGASYPFWSPDSRSIGFFAGGNKLKRIDIGGGLPQTLADAAGGRGGTWGADGGILFAPTTGGALLRVPASGGQTAPVTKLDPSRQASHRFPQFLPDGRQFLFFVVGTPEAQGIYLGSLDAPETKRLTAADTAGAYAPPGWLLFIRQGTLVAQRFDRSRGELTGDPVTVADPVTFDNTNMGAFSVSAAGLVAYRSGGLARRQLTWFDRSGKALGTMGAPDETLVGAHLSPDGRRAAVHRTVQNNTDVWIVDADRTVRFTFDGGVDQFPVWSPDGSRIVFDSNRKGARNYYQKPSNSAGGEELFLESPLLQGIQDWSRDGRFLLYLVFDPKTLGDLWVLPMGGDRKPFVFLNTSADERHGQFSPDGRWVAYGSNESGRSEIYVRSFPGPGGQWLVSTSGGVQVRWSRDGKELYYIAPDGKLMAVPIAVKGGALEPGTPVALFQTRIWGGGANSTSKQQYDVTSDGRFLINVTTEDSATSPITLLQNWHPEPGK